MDSSELNQHSVSTWYERFFTAFVFGALPMFIWGLFEPPGESLVFAAFAATFVGSIFGVLAAIFGERMLDFLMNISW